MEVLHVFGVNWKLLLIQGVNFGLLLLILHRFLYKPLFKLLEERQQKITRGLEDAEAVKLEREQVVIERDDILRRSREEGGKIVEELHKQAVTQEHEMLRSAQEKVVVMLTEAEQQGKAAKEHLLRESEKEVARMAVLAAEKILRGTQESRVAGN